MVKPSLNFLLIVISFFFLCTGKSEARPRATHKRETRRLFHSLAYLLHML